MITESNVKDVIRRELSFMGRDAMHKWAAEREARPSHSVVALLGEIPLSIVRPEADAYDVSVEIRIWESLLRRKAFDLIPTGCEPLGFEFSFDEEANRIKVTATYR